MGLLLTWMDKEEVIKYFSDHKEEYDNDMHDILCISEKTASKLYKLIKNKKNPPVETGSQFEETDEELWWFYHYYEIDGDGYYQIEYLKKLADRGDVTAMFEVGRNLESSLDGYCDTCPDECLSIKQGIVRYYTMAIEKGHVEAMYWLGLHFLYVKDTVTAKKYLEMAIAKGHVKAYCALAECYIEENTLDACETAKTYLLAGVAHNDIESMTMLGKLHLKQGGGGTTSGGRDPVIGIKYSTMAYERSLGEKDHIYWGQAAIFNLGHYFQNKEDYERMHSYYDMIPDNCYWKARSYCYLGFEYFKDRETIDQAKE